MKLSLRLLFAIVVALAPIGVADLASAGGKDCPPGLAKKNPPCVPPGQAKKGVTADEWQHRDRIGDVVDRDDLIFLDDYWRYDLPRLPDDQRYAVFDDRIVVLDSDTYRILQLVRIFRALAD